MKIIIYMILFFVVLSLKGQIAPILDHTRTIEKIDTGSQTITADLNPFGEYDTMTLTNAGILESTTFYYSLFGHCEFYFSFDDTNSQFYYHLLGCALSNQDSSQIALYFNQTFIQQNTNLDNSFPDTFPATYGPLSYNFTTVGDLIYLDITNSIGEVATFYAINLSQEEFLKNAISVYPNPATEVLKIESSGIALDHVNIYDMRGRLIEEYKKVNSSISLGHLQEGVYILEIETSVGILWQKVLKE